MRREVYIRARPSQIPRAGGVVKRDQSSPVHGLVTDHGGSEVSPRRKTKERLLHPPWFFFVFLSLFSLFFCCFSG